MWTRDPHTAMQRQSPPIYAFLGKSAIQFLIALLWYCDKHGRATRIGLILMIGGTATVMARTAAGALVDATRWQRGLILVAAGIVAADAVVLSVFPRFWPTVAARPRSAPATRCFRRRRRGD
jgi:hypothetical protein